MNHIDNRGETSRTRRWAMASLIAVGAATFATGSATLAGAAQNMGHSMGGHAAMDPAAMERHINALVDNVLAEGTAEQKARLAGLIRSAHADIGPFHAQFQQAHQRAHVLFMQPRVDRAALESLRAEQVRQLDATSRRLVQVVADAADMLTPEQRTRLFEQLHGQMR